MVASAAFLIMGPVLSGCDMGPKPNASFEADRLKIATELRSYYDKANGDYSALSAADKAAFAKLCGGKNPEQVFNGMKGPGPRIAHQGGPNNGG